MALLRQSLQTYLSSIHSTFVTWPHNIIQKHWCTSLHILFFRKLLPFFKLVFYLVCLWVNFPHNSTASVYNLIFSHGFCVLRPVMFLNAHFDSRPCLFFLFSLVYLFFYKWAYFFHTPFYLNNVVVFYDKGPQHKAYHDFGKLFFLLSFQPSQLNLHFPLYVNWWYMYARWRSCAAILWKLR